MQARRVPSVRAVKGLIHKYITYSEMSNRFDTPGKKDSMSDAIDIHRSIRDDSNGSFAKLLQSTTQKNLSLMDQDDDIPF